MVVKKIEWDTDGISIDDLPEEVEIMEAITADEVADYLSDVYGWCVKSFYIVPDEAAEWIFPDDWPTCSNCGEEAPVSRDELESRDKVRPATTPFCPWCGKPMKN